ncbi:hypothetical protein G9C85_00735 [Halorubellus sp. JP-L1]|uniref:DUF7289 family protein n=1 Tax=Halorubellus sp. JP-L1 TaxID=2715753 RepID=UPI001407442F|nr:hypothetical protein [Halorubellus sp. JP-L1]NHN40161.1 hypothetical protein [Halorubellus sp. JP-L1]
MSGPFRRDDRAVSDVLAFIMVFSIIITSVALVYGTGFSSIKQVSEGEQKANAERAMEALSLSLSDIEKGEASRRGGSLNLGGGQLGATDLTAIEVIVDGTTVTRDASGSVGPNVTGSLEYSVDDTAVAYESGGVFRRDGSASVTVVRPTVTCTSDRAIVSLVKIESPDGRIGADGNVEVSMAEQETRLLFTDSNGPADNTVKFDVTGTDYAPAWERTLDEQGWGASTTGSNSVEASCNTERVVVRLVVIEVTYDTP